MSRAPVGHGDGSPRRPGLSFPVSAMTSKETSYAHGVSLTPLLGQTVADNLRRTVERHGDRDALVMPSHNYRASYRRFWDETTQAARALLAIGVRPGDRVGV